MNADASTTIAGILISLIAVAALYVWTAIALSAVFRKSGEEAWKAWVPILNTIVLLQLGGLSPWLVLLALVPVLGQLALWVVIVLACYRINVAFGFGVGMTVLAALLLPAWATVLGFGSARWVGAEPAGGVRRSADSASARPAGYASDDAGPPPLPPASAVPLSGPDANAGWAPAASTPPRPAPPVPPMPSFPAPVGAAVSDDPEEPISFVPVHSASAPSAPPVPQAPAVPDTEPAPALPAPASSARANQGWGGFDLGAVGELTSEVTAAVSGAPHPIAAVPAGTGPEADAVPPTPAVTRVPAARAVPDVEPWAPARSPLPEEDAFPEASGEVSAVAGAPDAGIPRSARASVSAQHVLPEIPDDVEETVIANRRRSKWSLMLPSGSSVELTADVVLVGRRPAPSTAYPSAQLVEVDDGTVSKTHLRLERHGEEWSATDLHSTNGTILVASDGAEREIVPGTAHRAPGRLLLGDAELRLGPDDGGR
ncbi:DUF5684 domain-containing protein [Microbacterium sulfonylureivorans]|uniref:DUF5684 domain-containing protein n=1 Tax=Microbacterium sulfonylureivorans TaxID=2486854 RepID=UPI000FD70825|nr:DUF5684 domain-containing protein [Microbacterium sulfonylureivorans]